MRTSILFALSMSLTMSFAESQQPAVADIKPPVALNYINASYPPEAASSKANGKCAVSLVVGSNGVPKNLKIIRCTDQVFAKNSLAAVAEYRFKPATDKAGAPVEVTVTVQIDFRVQGGHDPKLRIHYSRSTPPGITSVEPTADGVYPYSIKMTPPTLVSFADEGYGDAAFANPETSGCDLVITIDGKGRASSPESVHCEGKGIGIAIAHSIADSRFEPGKVDGKPVPVRMAMHIEFVGFFPEN